MKNFWLIALLFSLAVPLSAQTKEFPETSGNAFLRLCSAIDKENKTDADYGHMLSRIGYVSGFTSGVAYEEAFAKAIWLRR